MSAKVISVSNQKGGVAKTTTVVNLAWALTRLGKSVLILDMDPQANASDTMGVNPYESQFTMVNVLTDKKKIISTSWTKTRNDMIYIVPSHIKLSAAERDLYGSVNSVMALRTKLDRVALENFDFILVDCPPSLGLLTINALVASQSVIIPLEADSYYALQGIDSLESTIEDIRELNPGLAIEGILLTMYDNRTSICKAMAEEIHTYFGNDKVFKTIIRRNTAINQATLNHLTIFEHDRRAYGVYDYTNLARELLHEPIEDGGNEEADFDSDATAKATATR